MREGFQPEREKLAGNDRWCGPCCATRRMKARPVTARQNSHRVNASTRPLRQKNGIANRTNCHRDRPRADWIEVAVPALVSEETFALAQEQLTKNKHHSPRRTIESTLLQGMLVCQQCGYALYRTSTRTSKRKLYYYRCLGSDAYRHFKGALC